MTVDFYCKNCRKDYILEAHEERNMFARWHEARCVCYNRLIRYIDEKHLDPYYRLSPKVRYERDKYARDVIQPGDGKFKFHYKDSYDKMERAAEAEENKVKKQKQKDEEFYKEYSYNIVAKNLAKKVLHAEGGK